MLPKILSLNFLPDEAFIAASQQEHVGAFQMEETQRGLYESILTEAKNDYPQEIVGTEFSIKARVFHVLRNAKRTVSDDRLQDVIAEEIEGARNAYAGGSRAKFIELIQSTTDQHQSPHPFMVKQGLGRLLQPPALGVVPGTKNFIVDFRRDITAHILQLLANGTETTLAFRSSLQAVYEAQKAKKRSENNSFRRIKTVKASAVLKARRQWE